MTGRRHQEGQEAVGGGVPVEPEEESAARTEPFEISQEAADRQDEEAQPPTEEEEDEARIQADLSAIEGIRRAEVGLPPHSSQFATALHLMNAVYLTLLSNKVFFHIQITLKSQQPSTGISEQWLGMKDELVMAVQDDQEW